MSLPDTLSAIDAMTRRLSDPKAVIRAVALSVAPEIVDVIDANCKASLDPYGAAWQATLDGSKPLINAANAVNVASTAAGLRITLTGPENLHHTGTARGRVMRRIIPTTTLPANMSRVVESAFARVMREGS